MELMFFGLRKSKGEIRLWNGLKIFVRSKMDLFIMEEIYINKVYDQKPLVVAQGGTVVDVGAHIGIFALYAVKRWKAKKVVCFEPCPENYAGLTRNIQNNNLTDIITANPQAISGQTEKRSLHVCADNDACHSLYSTDEGEVVQVQCVTLKQALEMNHISHVDYLKLDCEGPEWEILKSLDGETLAKIDVIGMEIHDRPRMEFVGLVKHLGFTIFDSEDKWRDNMILGVKNKVLAR
jgi:FkbM family methyltransferase